MNNKSPIRWMGAVCVLLAACSSTDSNRMSSTEGSTSSSYGSTGSTGNNTGSNYGNSNETTGNMSSSGNTAATTGSGASATSATGGSSATAQTSYGVVQTIDQVMRQDVGVGAVGAAAAGGTVGAPTDKVYRVKIKLDDGTEQTVVVDTMPTYQVGDRIRYSNGTVQRY